MKFGVEYSSENCKPFQYNFTCTTVQQQLTTVDETTDRVSKNTFEFLVISTIQDNFSWAIDGVATPYPITDLTVKP